MIKRKEYIDGKFSHREYYSQFITSKMVEQVKNKIGIDRIKSSKDEHFNDIPLKEWDMLSGHYFIGSKMVGTPRVSHEFAELCKQADEWTSSATLTCTYKEIARQLVEGKLK